METIKTIEREEKGEEGESWKQGAIRVGKRVEKLQLRLRGSAKGCLRGKSGEIGGNRSRMVGQKARYKGAKYSISAWHRTIPLNFHRIRAIGGIPFYP